MPQIKISFPTLLFFASFLLYDPDVYAVLPLVAALLHECGHFCVILLCKRKVTAIRIYPFGIDIRCAPAISSYRADLAVCLAGVATNLFAALCAFPFLAHESAMAFFGANLMLCLLNLLPIDSLDGGCALWALLSLALPPERVCRITRITSFVGVFLLWVLACDYLLVTGYHFSLFCMAVYLFVTLFLPPRKTENKRE